MRIGQERARAPVWLDTLPRFDCMSVDRVVAAPIQGVVEVLLKATLYHQPQHPSPYIFNGNCRGRRRNRFLLVLPHQTNYETCIFTQGSDNLNFREQIDDAGRSVRIGCFGASIIDKHLSGGTLLLLAHSKKAMDPRIILWMRLSFTLTLACTLLLCENKLAGQNKYRYVLCERFKCFWVWIQKRTFGLLKLSDLKQQNK